MNKYWFKPKWFGWGFYPVTWEGWLASLVLVSLVILSGWHANIFSETAATPEEVVRFILDTVLLCGLASLFFERKMKEPLKWRWGK